MTTELHNETLDWAAEWIEGSLKGEFNERVKEFGRNMAMTFRAAKTVARVPIVDAVDRAIVLRELMRISCASSYCVCVPMAVEKIRALAAASPVAPQQSAAGPKSNLEPHAYQEHPLYPNYCAFAVGDEDYCKRESDNAIHTTVPAPSAAIQDETENAARVAPLRTALDEIEVALISIADGVSPQEAVGKAFNIINHERSKLNAAASERCLSKGES